MELLDSIGVIHEERHKRENQIVEVEGDKV